MKEGGRRAAFPARQEAKGLLPPRLTHRSSADVRAQLTKPQRTGRDGAGVPEGRAVPGGRDCLSFCRGCLRVLHLLQVPSGLHRTHRVHGHLRDHSLPPFPPPLPFPPPRGGGRAEGGWGRQHCQRGARGWAPSSPARRSGVRPPAGLPSSLPRAPAILLLCRTGKHSARCEPLQRKNQRGEERRKSERSPHTQFSPSSPLRGGRWLSLNFCHNFASFGSVKTLSSTELRIAGTLYKTEWGAGRREIAQRNAYLFHHPVLPAQSPQRR